MSSVGEPSLCVFANFFIDNEERFQRMKDSFFSFKDVNPSEWRINIRGRMRADAGDFLRSQIAEGLALFFLESSRGWFFDSKVVMKDASSDYVFFWVEDHICIGGVDYFRDVLIDLYQYKVEYLLYSFLIDEIVKQYYFAGLPIAKGSIKIWSLDKEAFERIRGGLGRDFYIVSCVSITHIELFRKIMSSRRPIIRRWPINLPFDFEKLSKDGALDNLVCALPKRELFVCIDDDHGQKNYSLIARGLYSSRITRGELKEIEYSSKSFYFIPWILRAAVPGKLSGLIRRLFFSISFLLRG